jgi:hypothetical protein
MKKLVLVLLLIALVSFGQDGIRLDVDKKIEFSKKNDLSKGYGLSYSGNGVYTYVEKIKIAPSRITNDDYSGKISAKKWSDAQKKGRTSIMNFANQNNYTYKTINVEKLASVRNLIMTFKVFNKDGSLVINKDEAKKELLSLKEHLDLGIITQEEFDTKAVSLKKILLGN